MRQKFSPCPCMICNLLDHCRGLPVSFQVDEIIHELKHVQRINTWNGRFGKWRSLSCKSTDSLSDFVIVTLHNWCRDWTHLRVSHDFSPDDLNQSVVFLHFDHLTIVDTGLTIKFCQGVNVLGIPISENNYFCLWSWQLNSFKNTIEKPGTSGIRSFAPVMNNQQPWISLDSSINPEVPDAFLSGVFTMFVFFGWMSRFHPVRSAPGRSPEDSIRWVFQRVFLWDDNTGIQYPGDDRSLVQLLAWRFSPYCVCKLTRLLNDPDASCTRACFLLRWNISRNACTNIVDCLHSSGHFLASVSRFQWDNIDNRDFGRLLVLSHGSGAQDSF